MTEETKETETLAAPEEDRHTIYFAGGCFWGWKHTFRIPGFWMPYPAMPTAPVRQAMPA